MKKGLLMIFFGFLLVGCDSRVVDGLMLQDRNGIYYELNQTKPYTGKAIIKYQNGELRVEANFKDGKEEGVSKNYYESGLLQAETNFKYGKKEGVAKSYYEGGLLREEANYKNGKLHGAFEKYYQNGQLQRVGNYVRGEPRGVFTDYDWNGKITSEEKFGTYQNYSNDRMKDFEERVQERGKKKSRYDGLKKLFD